MAKMGAFYIQWAPFASTNAEPADALPNYGTPVIIGALQKVSYTVNKSEVSQYGDDVLQEYIGAVKDLVINVEIAQILLSSLAAMHGATGSTDIAFATTDNQPWGGLAFGVHYLISGVHKYQGVYFPKTKCTPVGDDFETKGESVQLAGGKLQFKGAEAKNHVYLVLSELLSTEAACKTWCDTKLGVTSGSSS